MLTHARRIKRHAHNVSAVFTQTRMHMLLLRLLLRRLRRLRRRQRQRPTADDEFHLVGALCVRRPTLTAAIVLRSENVMKRKLIETWTHLRRRRVIVDGACVRMLRHSMIIRVCVGFIKSLQKPDARVLLRKCQTFVVCALSQFRVQ